jgi:uncharacterized protein (TIGR00730 family)
MAQCIKAGGQLIYGAWQLGKLPHPIVTIFGSARTLMTEEYSVKAYALGEQLGKRGISIVTGGGPGIMEAASCGAMRFASDEDKIVGIGVVGLQPRPNPCIHAYIQLDYFFTRKWLLMKYAKVFIVFPGGFGTFDELAELLTLIQSKKIASAPIFLVGKAYWQPLVNWMYDTVLKEGAIDKEDVHLIFMTDDVDIIVRECERMFHTSMGKKEERK